MPGMVHVTNTPRVRRTFAQSPLNQYATGIQQNAQLPVPPAASSPIGTNPLFGRPGWTYTSVQRGPARGPQPRLARGTGMTGDPSLPGNASQLPGYLSDNEYFPSTFTYDPTWRPSFLERIPRTINTGDDGREVVGTYKPHDSTPGQRFNHQFRRAPAWQTMEFPPNFRNLLQWQQVRKYRVQSFTMAPRVLDSNNYFLGYTVDPQVAAQLGGSTLGSMGSQ